MIQTLIGRKIEQTQRFLADGTRIPVTVIAVPKTSVTQIKTIEKDGYSAVQIGIGTKKKPTQALLGRAKKAHLTIAPIVLREVHERGDEQLSIGDTVSAGDVFKNGDVIKVSGVGKGKGFAGGVKRHGFRGGPRTHGQSDRERAPGSIGQTTTPGRVYKGKRMAGHMGAGNVSVSNLVVVAVDNELMLIKGLVPGALNSTIYIEKTGEMKNPLELYESSEEKAAREAGIQAASGKQNTEENVDVEPVGQKSDETMTESDATETRDDAKEELKEVKSETTQPIPEEAKNMTKETKGDKSA